MGSLICLPALASCALFFFDHSPIPYSFDYRAPFPRGGQGNPPQRASCRHRPSIGSRMPPHRPCCSSAIHGRPCVKLDSGFVDLFSMSTNLALNIKGMTGRKNPAVSIMYYQLLGFLPTFRAVSILPISSSFDHLIKLAHCFLAIWCLSLSTSLYFCRRLAGPDASKAWSSHSRI